MPKIKVKTQNDLTEGRKNQEVNLPKAKTIPKIKGKKTNPSVEGKIAKQKLVIVESPAKARTLNKILGRSYTVKASLGHIRDLPRTSLGVDVAKDFTPKYVIPQQKKRIIREIRDALFSMK